MKVNYTSYNFYIGVVFKKLEAYKLLPLLTARNRLYGTALPKRGIPNNYVFLFSYHISYFDNI